MSNILDFLLSIFCGLFGLCEQDNCGYQDYSSNRYIVCSYAVKDISVGLFLRDGNGEPFGGLSRLERGLDRDASMLMNGGMYHDDLDAVGLYIEAGKKQQSISTKSGWGNFHLLPNGVFWGKGGTLAVSETKAFIKKKISPDFATQSGPMLVINGRLHPRFLKDSDSRKIRNGVGISKDGKTIHFAISTGTVTFWEFGELFQKKLATHNALFLDGTVSAIRTQKFRQGGWRQLGPLIGVFKKAKK